MLSMISVLHLAVEQAVNARWDLTMLLHHDLVEPEHADAPWDHDGVGDASKTVLWMYE